MDTKFRVAHGHEKTGRDALCGSAPACFFTLIFCISLLWLSPSARSEDVTAGGRYKVCASISSQRYAHLYSIKRFPVYLASSQYVTTQRPNMCSGLFYTFNNFEKLGKIHIRLNHMLYSFFGPNHSISGLSCKVCKVP